MFTKIKKNKKLVIAFFLIIFFGAVHSIKNCFSDELSVTKIQTETWNGQKILEGKNVLSEGHMLTIEKGTEVIFKENASLILESAAIDATGTEKEPIIFRSESGSLNDYFIGIDGSSGIYFKNVDISGGGKIRDDSEEPPILSFLNKAQAEETEIGVLNGIGSNFIILDNCDIHDNKIGIVLAALDPGVFVQVNRTKFINNEISVLAKNYQNYYLDFRYNFWESENYEGIIDDSHKKTIKDFKDPVIIIPGIMGSEEKDGELQLDPIFHVYDNLVESLINDGYEIEINLFLFPYEWRNSNIDNAVLLKQKIDEIKSQTNSNKVDIVAHSMGGLLTRQYLESDSYQEEDIDQLITLGTPHNGSPESYPVFEAGKFGVKLEDKISEYIFEQEAEKAGYDSIFDYIHQRPIESVRELLPTYDYLYDKDSNQYKNYPDGYPKNEFLENLNGEEKISALKWVEFINIYGNTQNNSTITEYKVINEMIGGHWQHGFPDNFYSLLGDRGIVYGIGDETVPMVSALYPSQYAAYNLELNSAHIQLPTEAQQDVLEFLTGQRPTEKVDDSIIENMLFASVFSPIDVMIVLSDGRRIGTDPETGDVVNEIEGAYYSGNDTENEFITIPNYEDGEYQILTSGTGTGDFRIEISSLVINDQGEAEETQTEKIQGTTAENETQEFALQIGESSSDETDGEEDSEQNDDSDNEENEEDDDKDDEDEDDEDDEDEGDEDKNEDKILGHEKNAEKKEALTQRQEEKKEFIQDKKIAKKQEQEQKKAGKDKTKVAGEQTSKTNPWVIAVLILIGAIALYFTWTIGKGKNNQKKNRLL